MLSTLLAILTAAFLIFTSAIQVDATFLPYLGVIMTILSIGIALVTPFLFVLAMTPLQHSAHQFTPRMMELFRTDPGLRWGRAWLFAFPFFTLLIAFDLFVTSSFSQNMMLASWIVLLGISFDVFSMMLKRMIGYQNPDFVVSMCAQEAKRAIQEDREIDLCRWIDSLSEIGSKAIVAQSPSLANEAINQLAPTIKIFLEASQSLAHSTPDKQAQELGISDKISYTLFFTFQRLEGMFDKALKNNFEPVCSNIIANLGKMAISCAKLEFSLASYPIIFIGKFAKKGITPENSDIGLKATYTLLEVGKTIIQETNTAYGDLKDPFVSIVTQMEALAKETFRTNKEINISILTQPLKDLKELFKEEKVAKHPDVPVILQNINNVLGEFEALEMVMRTIPSIPTDTIEEGEDQGTAANTEEH